MAKVSSLLVALQYGPADPLQVFVAYSGVPLHCGGGGYMQGFTKWLYRLSEITETPISHGNFSLEITYKIPQKGYI